MKEVEIFCCYARQDHDLLMKLKMHLMPLQRQGLITIWSDTDLNAGTVWEEELHLHLERADILLLLISPDFMASNYCYSIEMQRAIERHNQGSARVIPILLRPVFWRNAPFAKLQVIPTNAEPVTSWSDHDKAFSDVADHIHRVITGQQVQPNQPLSSPVALAQATPLIATSSPIDINGRWSDENAQLYLFLRQNGAKITGEGNVLEHGDIYGHNIKIDGSILGLSIELKATPVTEGDSRRAQHAVSGWDHYELRLVLSSPGVMHGRKVAFTADPEFSFTAFPVFFKKRFSEISGSSEELRLSRSN